MSLFEKSLRGHYLFTFALLIGLSIYAFKLHQFSSYSIRLIGTIRTLQDTTKEVYDANFRSNIDRQISAASPAVRERLDLFKQNSNLYPQNLAADVFHYMDKFDVVMEDFRFDGDTVTCHLLVRDKTPITVTAKFIQKGNIFLLDDLDNICALYSRLECHDLYLNNIKKIQK